jgi:acyl-CoA thioesterase-2
MASIEDILELERIENDIFRGRTFPSMLHRTFGGQVAGQALVSAVNTVGEDYRVHSLHGYFIRPGNPNEPTVYMVERIRDGRSFCTRRVISRRRRGDLASGHDAARGGAGKPPRPA